MLKKDWLKVVLVGSLVCIFLHSLCFYTRHNCIVCDVSGETVAAKDGAGNIWEFEGTDFEVGDWVDLKMYDNGTTDFMQDDKVIEAKGKK